MSNLFLTKDLSEVWRMKALMGISQPHDLFPTHPLRSGFEAASKELQGLEELNAAERQSLAEIKLVARAIFAHEKNWRSRTDQLAADLRHPEECRSLMFELHVMNFAVSPVVKATEWTHYKEAWPDLEAYEPGFTVECKFVRSDKLFRIESKLEEARNQHHNIAGPFVIAVGFDHQFERTEIENVLDLAQQLAPWFKSSPEVSAGLIFTPADPSVAPNERIQVPLGLRGSVALYGAATEVRNNVASHPLPQGFSFKRA